MSTTLKQPFPRLHSLLAALPIYGIIHMELREGFPAKKVESMAVCCIAQTGPEIRIATGGVAYARSVRSKRICE